MKYYYPEEIKELLDGNPLLKDKLYCRGFLLTDRVDLCLRDYPFYGNWYRTNVGSFEILTHHLQTTFVLEIANTWMFLIGHAYNPFSMQSEENDILRSLYYELEKSEDDFWTYESQLTGIFCIGYVRDGMLTYATDCCGMQIVYRAIIGNHIYLSSNSKLIADICGLEQSDYIRRLINYRYYHFFGNWLPGDLSPYDQVKRTQPNFAYVYNPVFESLEFKRIFPTKPIVQREVGEAIEQLALILSNSMELIADKWPNKRAALALTGGRDSTTSLACMNGIYDSFQYFSYISNEAEAVDANAAHEICEKLGIQHCIYEIPDDNATFPNYELHKIILECNSGCLGPNNSNDIRKRIYLDSIKDFDVEIKSWVNELARGDAQHKYETTRFPADPTAGYWRCMWKPLFEKRLIRDTDKVFEEYLDAYYDPDVFSYLNWTDLYFWEFGWSGLEGLTISSEHRYSYDMTIPFNNRAWLEIVFSVPEDFRNAQGVPAGIIDCRDDRISRSGVLVNDISHTHLRAFILRQYLRFFSRVR